MVLKQFFCIKLKFFAGESIYLFVLIFSSQGGLAPGGFNFDAKLLVSFFPFDSCFLLSLPHAFWMSPNAICFCIDFLLHTTVHRRRESTDVEDLFIAHISGMDTLARGLRNAAKIIEVICLYYSSFLCVSLYKQKIYFHSPDNGIFFSSITK